MTRRIFMMQTAACFLIFAVVHSGIHTKVGKLGDFLSRIAEAAKENYTLAELLEIGDTAEEAMIMVPGMIGETLMAASELGTYGTPMDENSNETLKSVYACAGGKVVKAGVNSSLGFYVILEHPGKISTYGHLSNIRVVTGERVTKGDILGIYDSTQEADFYYSLEDKSGNFA